MSETLNDSYIRERASAIEFFSSLIQSNNYTSECDKCFRLAITAFASEISQWEAKNNA